MTSVIETVGAFAGLIALVGLLVLAFLVISQARDLRRLREWAGGAPERDAELREVSEVVAEERAEEIRAVSEREERRLIRTGDLSPSFWERLGRSGQVMLVLAAVILVGAAAAWYLTGQDGGGSGGGAGAGGGGNSANSAKPSKFTVAVFNGTGGAEAGLAAEYSGFLEGKGFRLGATADAPETFDDTIVYYETGSKSGAELVAEEIDAASVELVPSEISQLAPSADVIAVIGLNHSDLPASGA
ncbi:MAG: LytR C-terminal domain-containing protein [Solirubrobacterales bacterium]